MSAWLTNTEQTLTTESLESLFDNKIPAIRINDFATIDECKAFSSEMQKRKLRVVQGATQHSSPAFDAQHISYIGLTQYEYKYRPINEYLMDADKSTKEVTLIYENSFDPVSRLRSLIEACTGLKSEIASDESGQLYAHAMLRKSNQGLALHADFAPYQAPQLLVSEANAQLAWNFYAEVPDAEGGFTTIFNNPWTWTRSFAKEVGENYPLERRMIDKVENFTFHPKEGDVIIFNSRNPHEVTPICKPGGKNRITLATFIARMPSGPLQMWS